jgi:hypothetical protein
LRARLLLVKCVLVLPCMHGEAVSRHRNQSGLMVMRRQRVLLLLWLLMRMLLMRMLLVLLLAMLL